MPPNHKSIQITNNTFEVICLEGQWRGGAVYDGSQGPQEPVFFSLGHSVDAALAGPRRIFLFGNPSTLQLSFQK